MEENVAGKENGGAGIEFGVAVFDGWSPKTVTCKQRPEGSEGVSQEPEGYLGEVCFRQVQ